MSLRKIKFGDKKVDKKEFYSSKQAIPLGSVDLNKIVVSNKWKINDTTYKYLCGYLNDNVIQPLCGMNGYIKYFEDGGKYMSFVIDDEVYEKYNEIWEVVRKLLKLKFTVGPVRDNKYIVAKLKIFNRINRTTFTDSIIPFERNNLVLKSVLNIDNKRAYPQAYLEQCKYKLKKRRVVNFINLEILTDSGDEISEEEKQKVIYELRL